MTARSQNGWPVLETAPPAVEVPGAGVRVTVRPGDVAAVLTHLAARYHREVEPLDLAVRESPGRDDWGWAHRPVRGQTSGFSNHASATAIDLNATRHPRGVRGTFTPVQVAAVRRILAALVDPVTGRCVVRWGEDYRSKVDGMHFEIDADAAAVARVAARIRARSHPARTLTEEIVALDPQDRATLVADFAAAAAKAVTTAQHDADDRVELADWVADAVGADRGTRMSAHELAQQAMARCALLQRQVDVLTAELRNQRAG